MIIWYDGKPLIKIPDAHERSIYSVSWKGDLIASAGSDNQLKIFQINLEQKSYTLLKEVDAHSEDVNCVMFSPVDSSMIATCSDDMDVKIWKLN